MKKESILFLFLGVFWGLMGVVYWFWSRDVTGAVMLAGSVFLGLIPGLYLYYWYRRSGYHLRAEDRPDASIEEGAGVIDAFPDNSMWPMIFAIGCMFGVLALVFGTWLAIPAIAFGLSAMIGFTAESRRGGTI